LISRKTHDPGVQKKTHPASQIDSQALSTRCDGPDNFILLHPKEKWPYHKTYAGLITSKDRWAVLDSDDHSLVLSTGNRSCHISREYYKEAIKNGNYYGVSFIIDKDRCIVNLFGSCCFTHKVQCIDKNSSKVLWSADVSAAALGGASSGVDHHMVEMLVHDGTLYVFGACTSTMYIEAFNVSDGSNIFRFGTN
jgi:outer membrane protein assembly factor BamB